MIKRLAMFLVGVTFAGVAIAQTISGGVVGPGINSGVIAPGAYVLTGVMQPGITPSGLGSAFSSGSPITPALPEPSTGVSPPVGAATAGTIRDGRVGTFVPGVTSLSGTMEFALSHQP